jgi:ribosomal protein L7/L12
MQHLRPHIFGCRGVEIAIYFAKSTTAQVAPSNHVMSLAADPRKRIEAIKAYREQTGAGLKVAVAVVDKIAASAKEAGA